MGGEICCELLIFVNGVAAGFEARLIAERIEKHFALVVSGMTNRNRVANGPFNCAIVMIVCRVTQDPSALQVLRAAVGVDSDHQQA